MLGLRIHMESPGTETVNWPNWIWFQQVCVVVLHILMVILVFSLVACNLSETSCSLLTISLKGKPSHLTELDLSINDLRDSGVKRLYDFLENPHCRLETLRLDPDVKPGDRVCRFSSRSRSKLFLLFQAELLLLDLSQLWLSGRRPRVEPLLYERTGPEWKRRERIRSEEAHRLPGELPLPSDDPEVSDLHRWTLLVLYHDGLLCWLVLSSCCLRTRTWTRTRINEVFKVRKWELGGSGLVIFAGLPVMIVQFSEERLMVQRNLLSSEFSYSSNRPVGSVHPESPGLVSFLILSPQGERLRDPNLQKEETKPVKVWCESMSFLPEDWASGSCWSTEANCPSNTSWVMKTNWNFRRTLTNGQTRTQSWRGSRSVLWPQQGGSILSWSVDRFGVVGISEDVRRNVVTVSL